MNWAFSDRERPLRSHRERPLRQGEQAPLWCGHPSRGGWVNKVLKSMPSSRTTASSCDTMPEIRHSIQWPILIRILSIVMRSIKRNKMKEPFAARSLQPPIRHVCAAADSAANSPCVAPLCSGMRSGKRTNEPLYACASACIFVRCLNLCVHKRVCPACLFVMVYVGACASVGACVCAYVHVRARARVFVCVDRKSVV